MKKILMLLTVAVMVWILATVAAAAINFTYDVNEDGTATVTGYTGDDTGSLLIPGEIDGYTVTAIGDSAFYDCRSLTGTLTIPDSVTSIGEYAFYCCWGLTGTLDLPDALESVGKLAFRACSGFTGTLTLPESLTTIGEGAFYECEGLSGTVTIPKNVSSVGGLAFGGYYGGYMGYSERISRIEVDAANEYYTSLDGILYSKDMAVLHSAPPGLRMKNLTIPDGVTHIKEGAFDSCFYITGKLILPEGLTAIGDYAFFNCSGFSEVIDVPASVTFLGRYLIANCFKLPGIRFMGTIPETWLAGALDDSYASEDFTLYVPSTHLDSTSGWTYPTWKAPDGIVYDTVVYAPDGTAYTPVGDLSGDGILDSDDVTAFTRWFAGHTVSLPTALADIDRNGKITRRDAMILARTVAGWDGYTLPWKNKR